MKKSFCEGSEYSIPERRRHRTTSSLREGDDEDQDELLHASISSSAALVQWNHFGHKTNLHFSTDDLKSPDLFAVLKKKIYSKRPEFKASLVERDSFGREILVDSSEKLRFALAAHNNRLKLHTSLSGLHQQFLSAEEMLGGTRNRSVSVPPHAEQQFGGVGCKIGDREAPVTQYSNYSQPVKEKPFIKNPSSKTKSCNACFPAYAMYQGNPYSQTMHFGMPPENVFLAHFVSQSAYGSIWPPPNFRHTWVGPNKLLYSGGLFPIGGCKKGGKWSGW